MRAVACDYFTYKGRSYAPGVALEVDSADLADLIDERRIVDTRNDIETAAVQPPEKQARGRPSRRIK